MKWIRLFEEFDIDTRIETCNQIFITFITSFVAQKFIQESNLRKDSVKVKKIKSHKWIEEERLPSIDIIAKKSTVIAQLEMTEDFKYLRITKDGFKLIYNFVNGYGGKSSIRVATKKDGTGSLDRVSSPLFKIFLEIINRIMDNLLKNELDTKDFLNLKKQVKAFVDRAFKDYAYIDSKSGFRLPDGFFRLV